MYNEESQTEHHSILGLRGIEMLGKNIHSEQAITSISRYVGVEFLDILGSVRSHCKYLSVLKVVFLSSFSYYALLKLPS